MKLQRKLYEKEPKDFLEKESYHERPLMTSLHSKIRRHHHSLHIIMKYENLIAFFNVRKQRQALCLQ